MNVIQKICLFFTILGALNWGLVGLFNWNLVTAIFGVGAVMTKIVYVVIAIASIINILLFFMPLGERKEHPEEYHSDYTRVTY